MYPALLGTLSSLLIMSDSVRFMMRICKLTVLFLLYRSLAAYLFLVDSAIAFPPPIAYNKCSKGLPWQLALRPTVDDVQDRQRLFLCS